MKVLMVRYFSSLLFFLTIGVNLFGSTDSKGMVPVADKINVENTSDVFQLSTNPIDRHGVFERTLEFSNQQVTTGSSREQFSISFYKKIQLSSRRSEFKMLEEKTFEYFSDLLGIRHIQGFYVIDLREIIV